MLYGDLVSRTVTVAVYTGQDLVTWVSVQPSLSSLLNAEHYLWTFLLLNNIRLTFAGGRLYQFKSMLHLDVWSVTGSVAVFLFNLCFQSSFLLLTFSYLNLIKANSESCMTLTVQKRRKKKKTGKLNNCLNIYWYNCKFNLWFNENIESQQAVIKLSQMSEAKWRV